MLFGGLVEGRVYWMGVLIVEGKGQFLGKCGAAEMMNINFFTL